MISPFTIFTIVVVFSTIIHGYDFTEHETAMQLNIKHIENEQKKRNNDFLNALDKPKQIDITCQGEAQISIKDLIINEAESSGYNGECAVINMKGNNFDFHFSLNCDGKIRTSTMEHEEMEQDFENENEIES